MRGIYILILILFPVYFNGQEALHNIHGLINEDGESLFEVSGYTITVGSIKGSVDDEETLLSVKESYGLDNVLITYADSALAVKNIVIESQANVSGMLLQLYKQCILLEKTHNESTILYLETTLKRDYALEKEILNACLNNQLAKYASSDRDARFMVLAGNKIKLASGSEWVAPNRIVNEDSQITWSEFSSMSRADQYVKNQMIIDKADEVECIREEDIKVLIDNVPVTVRRVVYQDMVNPDASDYLIVYYAMTKLREWYVGCILSHYGRNADEYGLPVFLRSVMTLSEANKQVADYNRAEKEAFEHREMYRKYNSYLFELQFSSWMPLGNLRNVYEVAPTLGMYFGFPIGQRLGIDVGGQVGLPINSSFEYYDFDSAIETEATSFIGLNARMRYHGILARNVMYSSYFGVGANWLSTDIESGYNEEYDYYEYEKVTAVDVFGGINVRYKRIGGFIEYHYTPYGNSGKMKYTIGHSSINIGVSWALPIL